MTTSGSVDFSVSRDDIIKQAYRHVLGDEDFTLTTNQTTNAALLLNGIVKAWNAVLHVPIWSLSLGYILPVTNVNSATVPAANHVVSSFSISYLASSSAASASTITLDTAPGNISSYAIGIELDNGDMHWTTVNGAPVGAVVTLTTALPSAASSGNYVYHYITTSRIQKPIRVVGAFRTNVTSVSAGAATAYTSIPIEVATSTEYFDETTNFLSEGQPIKLAYEPLVSTGTLRWWPRFQDGTSYIFIRYSRTLEDFDATGDTPDFPQEWYMPLIYELAVALAPTYTIPVEKYQMLSSKAKSWFELVSENDYEEGSIVFYPKGSME